MAAMRRRCDQKRARPCKTVPHHSPGTREDLIGHEEGEFGAGGGRTNVFATLQIEVVIDVALTLRYQTTEVDLLDLWGERILKRVPSPMWPQSKERMRSRSGCFIWIGPGRFILSKTDWMYFFWLEEEMLFPKESISSFQLVWFY